MDDARSVRFGEAFARLEHTVDGELSGEGAALEEVTEVRALEQIHHDVRQALLGGADVEDADHMLALDARRCLRLPHEALEALGISGELGMKELHRDPFLQVNVLRGDDGAHAALADDALDAIATRDEAPRDRQPSFARDEWSDLRGRAVLQRLLNLSEPGTRSKREERGRRGVPWSTAWAA
jgi:hypothetical protein